VISHTNEKFRKLYATLSIDVRKQARMAYSQFKTNPYHPSLQFKRIHSSKAIYSVRINIDYRAVGILDGIEVVWFWIGHHNEYDKIITRFR